MQIILSRKGFDSQYGKQASPILPDGTLLSFPIPLPNEIFKFSEIKYDGKTYLEIIKDLNPKTKIKDYYTCHLDPDLRYNTIQREDGWLPLFGQTDAAQGHLLGKEIKEGDLFLFFGTFKETEIINGKLKYKKNTTDKHVIYGYLQIGSLYCHNTILPKQLLYHPHAQRSFKNNKNNCIYKAIDKLSFNSSTNGGGCLFYHNELVLTKQGYSKSKWNLPDFFKNIKITYHSEKSFSNDYFQSAAKGQEFIIEENDEVTEWAKNIVLKGTRDAK
jgi:hypothetical protein